MRWWWWIPLVLFALFLGVAGYQLTQPRDEFIPSRMVDKPLPDFALEPAIPEMEGVSADYFRDGKPRLLNIFASWCLPCIAEAPHLERLRLSGAEIVGVANRDEVTAVQQFLARNGNPYSRIGADPMNELSLAVGASGVPETYVIDGKGRIVYQHIGDVRAENVPELLRMLQEAGE